MAGIDYFNLFYLTYDGIHAMKKKDLVYYIENMKGKLVADKQIQHVSFEITDLLENVKSLASTSERLKSELMVVKNINSILENRIVNLENKLSKNEQYGRWNNVELPGVSNYIPDQDLEESIIKTCKDLDINTLHMDIEVCHRFPLGKKHNKHNETSYCEIC